MPSSSWYHYQRNYVVVVTFLYIYEIKQELFYSIKKHKIFIQKQCVQYIQKMLHISRQRHLVLSFVFKLWTLSSNQNKTLNATIVKK